MPGRGSGGAAPAFAQVFNLLGKYQPYGVYVPRSVTRGTYGVQMEWHGSNQGIVAQINQPGMQQQFGENLGRLLVTPEARGPNGYGSDVSERDLIDVMADVARTFPVDTDRVFSSGYSQGGYITFRMAMLYPEVFAGFTGWVAFTGDDTNGLPGQGTGGGVTAGAVGNMIDFVGNARHVPGSMIYGAADELVPVTSAEAMREAFDAAGNPYRWWMHTPAEHLTFAVLDRWQKEADYSANQRRVHDPARVTYRTATFLDSPQYGIRHDVAYWVSRIRPRADGYADTDLTSSGCGAPVDDRDRRPRRGHRPGALRAGRAGRDRDPRAGGRPARGHPRERRLAAPRRAPGLPDGCLRLRDHHRCADGDHPVRRTGAEPRRRHEHRHGARAVAGRRARSACVPPSRRSLRAWACPRAPSPSA